MTCVPRLIRNFPHFVRKATTASLTCAIMPVIHPVNASAAIGGQFTTGDEQTMKRILATRTTLNATLIFVALLAMPVTYAQTTSAPAPKDSPAELFRRMELLDRALFDAFNRCEIEKLESFFIPELEFYHDNGGVTWTRERFISDVRKSICGKFRRELVSSTLEVWPIGDYGAIYSGTHRFCQFGAGKCEGIGRFMHIGQNKGGEWKVTRIISYDHKAAP